VNLLSVLIKRESPAPSGTGDSVFIPVKRYFRGPLPGTGNIFLNNDQAGLLAPGSPYSLRLPAPLCGAVVLSEAFVPGYSGGSAPDFNGIPLRLMLQCGDNIDSTAGSVKEYFPARPGITGFPFPEKFQR
jgi:hypothetical protein